MPIDLYNLIHRPWVKPHCYLCNLHNQTTKYPVLTEEINLTNLGRLGY